MAEVQPCGSGARGCAGVAERELAAYFSAQRVWVPVCVVLVPACRDEHLGHGGVVSEQRVERAAMYGAGPGVRQRGASCMPCLMAEGDIGLTAPVGQQGSQANGPRLQ